MQNRGRPKSRSPSPGCKESDPLFYRLNVTNDKFYLAGYKLLKGLNSFCDISNDFKYNCKQSCCENLKTKELYIDESKCVFYRVSKSQHVRNSNDVLNHGVPIDYKELPIEFYDKSRSNFVDLRNEDGEPLDSSDDDGELVSNELLHYNLSNDDHPDHAYLNIPNGEARIVRPERVVNNHKISEADEIYRQINKKHAHYQPQLDIESFDLNDILHLDASNLKATENEILASNYEIEFNRDDSWSDSNNYFAQQSVQPSNKSNKRSREDEDDNDESPNKFQKQSTIDLNRTIGGMSLRTLKALATYANY
ncbi:hypothetical protein BN7_209 [Wickerhamomyces ciferrii]|uniref:Uncharacterized protein n=1 Tax=Wickerhamomyces ciferrii (strain ATCC 14091 / BCRC 22168 / CBS 111 / JCM 3599 / NBRC 0793 / NRRL Y-1031 F-60-10) TaxID=1206466 RepID=K0K733_WICCF|nr:uncharacterized protein BN7_209 [Wickerhamomyces ciferrii]CCH40675.1 hypothetical protein BN7_209 [Wickerhamomyces ciferrii]